jgi:hypothetical protein
VAHRRSVRRRLRASRAFCPHCREPGRAAGGGHPARVGPVMLGYARS